MHFSESPILTHLFRNQKLADEIREIVAQGKVRGVEAGSSLQKDLEAFVDRTPPRRDAAENGRESVAEAASRRGTYEAIVRLVGRPPLLVREGTYVAPSGATQAVPQETLTYISSLQRPKIDFVIARTGRVDLIDMPGIPFLGTGWIIEKKQEHPDTALMVTNRHVALEFARADGRGGFYFRTAPNLRPFEVQIGLRHEHLSARSEQLNVPRVLYIAGDGDADMALIEVQGEHLRALDPLVPSTAPLQRGLEIGVVGYPAYDSRNDAGAMARYFDGIFNVKRFAFGEVSSTSERHPEFFHDATTLGGNSGSCVFDLASGNVVGLHFAGDFKTANYAVPIDQVLKAVAGLRTTAVVSRDTSTEAISDGINPPSFFEGRDGYNRDFLGAENRVDLPGLGETWADDIVDVIDADTGETVSELKYRHFSLLLSKSRKTPLVTAVNINGAQAKRVPRISSWYVDGRAPEALQVGNEAFKSNPLDRGHMVRREDPVWGSQEIARQANVDTFHYTNCSPQHEALNQREWLDLEDYVLDNAKTRSLMVSVLTGPILRDNDPLYRDVVKLPREFWKIAVIVNNDTGKLSATGYVLSQGHLIRRLTEAFVYGAFRTYQVPIALISAETGLDFSALEAHDPFARQRREEGLENTLTRMFNPIGRAEDMILT